MTNKESEYRDIWDARLKAKTVKGILIPSDKNYNTRESANIAVRRYKKILRDYIEKNIRNENGMKLNMLGWYENNLYVIPYFGKYKIIVKGP